MWLYFIIALIIIYFINEYIYYYRALYRRDNIEDYYFFPLPYTEEYSRERMNEYYRVVLTHCLFLHVSPVCAYSYCALNSI